MTEQPMTQAGRDHDADWRNLLSIAEGVVREYGERRGPVLPAHEMLAGALVLLRPLGGSPSLAIEREYRDGGAE